MVEVGRICWEHDRWVAWWQVTDRCYFHVFSESDAKAASMIRDARPWNEMRGVR